MRRRFLSMTLSVMICATLGTSIVRADETSSEVTTITQTTTEATTHATTEVTTTHTTESTTHKNTETMKKDTSKKNKKKKKKKKTKKEDSDQTTKKAVEKTTPSGVSQNTESLKSEKNKEYVGKYIYFNQGDSVWNNNGLSIHSAGCGPTAVAVCIANLTGKWVTPVDTASWASIQGLYSSSGSVHSAIPAMAKHWGLKSNGLGTDYESIKAALKDGKFVVGLMGPGYFTGGGHFITLCSIDDNDQVTVADVGSRRRTKSTYDLKYIIGQSKAASAGGPFWEIYNKETIKDNIPKTKTKTKKEIKKEKNEKKLKKEALNEFYQKIESSKVSYEKNIPTKSLLQGKKITNTWKLKDNNINQEVLKLGIVTNDELLIYISQNYEFGTDVIMDNVNLDDTNEIDLTNILNASYKNQ